MKKKSIFRVTLLIILSGILIILVNNCKREDNTPKRIPIVTTNAINSITQTSALGGGNVTSDGGFPVTSRGVCWSTGKLPTISDCITYDGNGTGSFSSQIKGLPTDSIHIRAYATNSEGTGYGNIVSMAAQPRIKGKIRDIDGNEYNTITFGTQTWMVENLTTTHYRNGEAIDSIPSNEEWSNHTTGAFCYYENYYAKYKPFGKLYNWYAVADSRNISPAGWHVPTQSDIVTLDLYLTENGYNYDGTTINNRLAKAFASGAGWTPSTDTGVPGSPDHLAKINATGFSALPGGCRDYDGKFLYVGSSGFWWSSTEYNTSGAWQRNISFRERGAESYTANKPYGFSVRCIKD